VAHITPRLSAVESSSGLHALSEFSRDKTPLDRLIRGERLFLAPPPIVPAQAAYAYVGEAGRSLGQDAFYRAYRWFQKALGLPVLEKADVAAGEVIGHIRYQDEPVSLSYSPDEILPRVVVKKKHGDGRWLVLAAALFTVVFQDGTALALFPWAGGIGHRGKNRRFLSRHNTDKLRSDFERFLKTKKTTLSLSPISSLDVALERFLAFAPLTAELELKQMTSSFSEKSPNKKDRLINLMHDAISFHAVWGDNKSDKKWSRQKRAIQDVLIALLHPADLAEYKRLVHLALDNELPELIPGITLSLSRSFSRAQLGQSLVEIYRDLDKTSSRSRRAKAEALRKVLFEFDASWQKIRVAKIQKALHDRAQVLLADPLSKQIRPPRAEVGFEKTMLTLSLVAQHDAQKARVAFDRLIKSNKHISPDRQVLFEQAIFSSEADSKTLGAFLLLAPEQFQKALKKRNYLTWLATGILAIFIGWIGSSLVTQLLASEKPKTAISMDAQRPELIVATNNLPAAQTIKSNSVMAKVALESRPNIATNKSMVVAKPISPVVVEKVFVAPEIKSDVPPQPSAQLRQTTTDLLLANSLSGGFTFIGENVVFKNVDGNWVVSSNQSLPPSLNFPSIQAASAGETFTLTGSNVVNEALLDPSEWPQGIGRTDRYGYIDADGKAGVLPFGSRIATEDVKTKAPMKEHYHTLSGVHLFPVVVMQARSMESVTSPLMPSENKSEDVLASNQTPVPSAPVALDTSVSLRDHMFSPVEIGLGDKLVFHPHGLIMGVEGGIADGEWSGGFFVEYSALKSDQSGERHLEIEAELASESSHNSHHDEKEEEHIDEEEHVGENEHGEPSSMSWGVHVTDRHIKFNDSLSWWGWSAGVESHDGQEHWLFNAGVGRRVFQSLWHAPVLGQVRIDSMAGLWPGVSYDQHEVQLHLPLLTQTRLHSERFFAGVNLGYDFMTGDTALFAELWGRVARLSKTHSLNAGVSYGHGTHDFHRFAHGMKDGPQAHVELRGKKSALGISVNPNNKGVSLSLQHRLGKLNVLSELLFGALLSWAVSLWVFPALSFWDVTGWIVFGTIAATLIHEAGHAVAIMSEGGWPRFVLGRNERGWLHIGMTESRGISLSPIVLAAGALPGLAAAVMLGSVTGALPVFMVPFVFINMLSLAGADGRALVSSLTAFPKVQSQGLMLMTKDLVSPSLSIIEIQSEPGLRQAESVINTMAHQNGRHGFILALPQHNEALSQAALDMQARLRNNMPLVAIVAGHQDVGDVLSSALAQPGWQDAFADLLSRKAVNMQLTASSPHWTALQPVLIGRTPYPIENFPIRIWFADPLLTQVQDMGIMKIGALYQAWRAAALST
jgi:hypothetical protein